MRLVAVVVTYNRLTQVKTTLRRLLAGPCDHVVVVDNGSTDGTRAWLAALESPRLHLVLSRRNLGGAGGFELGMRRAVRAYDPDWIVVMDDDARPARGALATFLAQRPQAADAVAAAVYYPDGRICEMNRPAQNPFRYFRLLLKTLLGGGRRGFHIPDTAYGGAGMAVDVASFVGLFLSRKAIRQAGYPDGRLFLYGDDASYTLGLTKQGLRLHFDPAIRFEHDCTTFKAAPRVYHPLWKVYYNYRNGLFLYRKTAGILFWPVLLVVVPKWVWNGRHYGGDRRQYYRLLARALRDGMGSGTGGKGPLVREGGPYDGR